MNVKNELLAHVVTLNSWNPLARLSAEVTAARRNVDLIATRAKSNPKISQYLACNMKPHTLIFFTANQLVSENIYRKQVSENYINIHNEKGMKVMNLIDLSMKFSVK